MTKNALIKLYSLLFAAKQLDNRKVNKSVKNKNDIKGLEWQINEEKQKFNSGQAGCNS